MLSNLERLGRFINIEGSRGDELPWSSIEEAWGLEFPEDYKEFLSCYGAGSFAGSLGISAPFPEAHEAYRMGMRMGPLDADMLTELQCPYPGYPCRGGVIAFGDTPNGDSLLYRTADEAEGWSIVTWSRRGGTPQDQWINHGLGFVDFMIALLNAKLSEYPFGAGDLWGAGRVTYWHWSDPRGR